MKIIKHISCDCHNEQAELKFLPEERVGEGRGRAPWSLFNMKPGNKQHCYYDHSSQGKEYTLEIGYFAYTDSSQQPKAKG